MTDVITLLSQKLVDIGKTVTGIAAAIDPPPANPTTAQLPLLYVLSGGARYGGDLGESFVETSRTLRVQVAVVPTGQGDPATREKACRAILEAVVTKYQSYSLFSAIDRVERVKVLSDSGIVVLPEYGYKFIGFEIPVEVTYFASRTYAPGE